MMESSGPKVSVSSAVLQFSREVTSPKTPWLHEGLLLPQKATCHLHTMPDHTYLMFSARNPTHGAWG